jgi:methyltransferase (TIGR00027 family)
VLNLQIAKAYLAGSDNGMKTRTWQNAIEVLIGTKKGANKERWLRVAEDRLADAVRRGVSQYVILGAGFDTFAFRQPDWAKSLKIFEFDHPDTQSVKRSFLEKAGLDQAANVHFAPINFEQESLLEGLLRQRVSLEEPTFISWLGVTMYLNEAAIDSSLKSMAAYSHNGLETFTAVPSAAILAFCLRRKVSDQITSVRLADANTIASPANRL